MSFLILILGIFNFIRGGLILPIITILISEYLRDTRGNSILIRIGEVLSVVSIVMHVIPLIFRFFASLV